MTRAAPRISAEIPVAAVVIGFTAVPMSLQGFDSGDLAGLLGVGAPSDVITNVLGFIPLGFVLAWRGPWRAIAVAAALSVGAEALQFFSPFRSPSFADVATNVLGAALGVGAASLWGRRRITVAITPLWALLAAALAIAGVAAGASLAPRALQRVMDQVIYGPRTALGLIHTNNRGLDAPGKLEAHWSFDRTLAEPEGGLSARAVGDPAFGPGVAGDALVLDGATQYAVARSSSAAQLAGSMTVSAWVKVAPGQEGLAAIVTSMSHLERGFAFYVSHDQDWRTVAIQLGALNGATATRYGRTELQPDRWYFVVATYDAPARALHVYVDGRLDDSCLLGRVGPRQIVSSAPIHFGRHAEDDVDYFPGAMDDARLYSRALAPSEIAALYAAVRPGAAPEPQHALPERCPSPPSPDPTSMGWLVIFGQLIAAALAGVGVVLRSRVARFVAGGGAGLVVAGAVLSNALLPIPILALVLTLAGAASVFVAIEPDKDRM